METRLIDANALKEKMTVAALGGHKRILVCGVIDDAPTVDAVPVKMGNWIAVDYKTMEHGFVEIYPNDGVCCSECRTCFRKSRLLIRSYCPNCGADMRGDKNGR